MTDRIDIGEGLWAEKLSTKYMRVHIYNMGTKSAEVFHNIDGGLLLRVHVILSLAQLRAIASFMDSLKEEKK